MSLYIQAAEQKWGQVISKKWYDSCVQLRLDPFLDKITQGAATWCPFHCSVSPITPSIFDSLSFFIWTVFFSFFLSLSLSRSCLSVPFLFFFSSLSLSFIQVPHITGWLSQFKCMTVWQKGTVSSIYFFPLLTPSCYIMHPGEAHWDAIRDTCAYLTLTLLIPLFLTIFLNFCFESFSPPHTKTACHSYTHRTALMTTLIVLIRVKDCSGK